jgi:Domain of unknown function (DUF4383)
MTTPRLVAMWSGIVMLVLGGLGLFFSGSGSLFGLFPMSLWLGIGFMVTGLLLWYASTGDELTHSFSMVIGLVYGILAVIGLFVRDFNLFGILPIEGWNIALFIALGVVMLYDWISTPASRTISGTH